MTPNRFQMSFDGRTYGVSVDGQDVTGHAPPSISSLTHMISHASYCICALRERGRPNWISLPA